MAKEIKIEYIKGKTIITSLVIETMNKEIGRVNTTEVGYMFHMVVMILQKMI